MVFTYALNQSPVQPSEVSYRGFTIAANTTLEWPSAGVDTANVTALYMRVTASTGGLTLTLPPANEVGPGYAVILHNIGSNAFTVAGNTGSTIVSSAAGSIYYIIVIDNSTVAGTWATIGFGASTTTANAADLAGLGLKAIAATLNMDFPETALNSNYSVSTGDRAQFLNWTGGIGTISFAAAATLTEGFAVYIRNSGSGTVTLDPDSTETINGQSTFDLAPDDSCVVISNGFGLFTVGYGRTNTFIFTRLVKNVTSSSYTLTTAEAANKIIDFQGTITGNVTVNFPATADVYWLKNTTSGSYSLTVQPTSGSGVTIAQGISRTVVCDGATMYYGEGTGGGTVTTINVTGDFTGGPITTSGTIGLATTGVGAGTYTTPMLVLDTKGRVTSSVDIATTKGDIVVNNGTSSVRVAIGSDNQVLTADSSQATGLKWASVSTVTVPSNGFYVQLCENFN